MAAVVAAFVALTVLAISMPAAAQGTALSADVVLYELTENMTLENVDGTQVKLRTATASLQGTARPNTPICPANLLAMLIQVGLLSGPAPCTITAIGQDEVNTQTGAGTLSGTFAVVVNADNPVDPAEFVVMTGTFEGTMQVLVDSSYDALPLIAITGGKFVPVQALGYPAAMLGIGEAPFGGVFRLPFALDARGKKQRARPHKNAYYLNADGTLVKVKGNELSLGMPTVRVEVTFP